MKSITSWSLIIAFVLLQGCKAKPDDDSGAAAETVTTTPSIAEDTQQIPIFEALTLAGDTLRSSDLVGKVVVVNFWATWCGPCVVETPELVSLRNEWEDREFEIIGVSMDEEGLSVIGDFADRFEISYPLIHDAGPLAEEFGGVYALPTTFVVSPSGEVLHRFIGVFPVDTMKEELDQRITDALRP